MNGAESLVKSLLASGVDTCFANPGTSEMHFVAALDAHPDMRCVLCLFEGGATGAADGYWRMKQDTAAVLLHLGPGFANGWANLHNARKAGSGIVSIVGDHAVHHLKHGAPLQSDLEDVARSVSQWVRVAGDSTSVARDGVEAVAAARTRNGQIATLILPADCAWGDGGSPIAVALASRLRMPDADRIEAAAKRLLEPGSALLVGGAGLFGKGAEIAGRIAARTGCRLLAPFFTPRIRRGAGAVAFETMRYNGDENAAFLEGTRHLVLVGEAPPVNFFAYPDKPSTPEPAGCSIDRLCYREWDVLGTLDALASAAGCDGSEDVARIPLALPDAPTGPLTADGLGAAIARALPEDAIAINEAVTAGSAIWPKMDTARPHDRTATTGGSIGLCLPAAVGAAIAAPDRQVLAVSGDGSAMYTIQSLWTMAREELDITVVIVANRGYQILKHELAAMGVTRYGRNAQAMFDLENPVLDFVAIAQGHGVPAKRVETAEAITDALNRAFATPGPCLIEAVI